MSEDEKSDLQKWADVISKQVSSVEGPIAEFEKEKAKGVIHPRQQINYRLSDHVALNQTPRDILIALADRAEYLGSVSSDVTLRYGEVMALKATLAMIEDRIQELGACWP